MPIERLLGICSSTEQTHALMSIQTELIGFAAYTAICENLEIKPIMTSYSYRGARSDLAMKHLRNLFNAWCNAVGFHLQEIHTGHDGADYLSFVTQSKAMPAVYFRFPQSTAVPNRAERLILAFSFYWKLWHE